MSQQHTPSDTSLSSGRKYMAPTLEELGLVARLTMGNGGSSLDGNCTYTQLGFGNDPNDGQNPQSCR